MAQLLAAPVLEDPLGVLGVVDVLVVVLAAVSALGLLSVAVDVVSLELSLFFAPPPLLL
jgi:hypothetical protein